MALWHPSLEKRRPQTLIFQTAKRNKALGRTATPKLPLALMPPGAKSPHPRCACWVLSAPKSGFEQRLPKGRWHPEPPRHWRCTEVQARLGELRNRSLQCSQRCVLY